MEGWRRKLIDLSRRNRLVFFKRTRSSTLHVLEPRPEAIFARLAIKKKPWRFWEPPTPQDQGAAAGSEREAQASTAQSAERRPSSTELVCDTRDPQRLARILSNLLRRSRGDFAERGVRILHITFGRLEWQEQDTAGAESVQSPILLLPVELVRKSARDPMELRSVEGEAILNPALEAKLQNDFGLELSHPPDDPEDIVVGSYLREIAKAVEALGWRVSPDVWISLFSFHKLVIYRDIAKNADSIRGNAIVRAIAGEPSETEQLYAAPPQPDELDRVLDPKDSFLVRDADGSQLACIEAVKRGGNLVLHGPPGTGKSQTITNVIAELVASGRTVLFVSEKMAALEVVHNRLREAALDDFCLELHDPQAKKREIVEQLDEALSMRLDARTSFAQEDFQRLGERRDQLNAYVHSLHEVRQPIGTTAFKVLAELAQQHSVPLVTFEGLDAASLTGDLLSALGDRVGELARVWGVFSEGDSFPWLGCTADAYSLGLVARLREQIESCHEALTNLRRTSAELSTALHLAAPESLEEVEWLADTAELLRECPGVPAQLLQRPFIDVLDCLQRLDEVAAAHPFARMAREYERGLLEHESLDTWVAVHSSRFRWARLGYYLSRRRIAPLRHDGRLPKHVLSDLKLAQKLRQAVRWTRRFRKHLGERELPEQLVQMATAQAAEDSDPEPVRQHMQVANDVFASLEAEFDEGYPRVSGVPLRRANLVAVEKRLVQMARRLEDLRDWVDYVAATEGIDALGLGALMEKVRAQSPSRQLLPLLVRKAVLQTWADDLFARDPALGTFRAENHERLIDEFRSLDRAHWQTGSDRVIAIAGARRPSADWIPDGSELQALRREANKKARHLPIRVLFRRIAELLLRLKPCLLMSPISVSQFLSPDVRFDLIVFDEASQMPTEDAVGAIYRGKQLLVCGDSKQLPPTAFFQTAMSDEFDDDEQDSEGLYDVFQSVLDACRGAGMRDGSLRWHYRSRHESLIAFSNRQFYSDDLVTFPSVFEEHDDLGVKFVHVPDGVYDRGGRSDNRREAQVVSDIIFEHFSRHADRSLGVVAFSQAQMQAIEDELERRVQHRNRDEVDWFFTRDRLDGFFVKNLENVQGDERDVMIFSVGYGRDANGLISMNFGPLNREGGERRLNVVVTRAREKVVVVSSIRDADINVSATRSAGVRMLHRYLGFAERGLDALATDDPDEPGEPESRLEEDVAGAIREMGFEPRYQVGCSRFRIDIGVVDPGLPGAFLLGVECDGKAYHSSYIARDKDRIRQQVLEDLGWSIHRIWSPDWVSRRATEVERLKAAIERAREARSEGRPAPRPLPDPARAASSVVPSRRLQQTGQRDCDAEGASPRWIVPYAAYSTNTKPGGHVEFHEPRRRSEQAGMVENVVALEGPVHVDVVARRLAGTWGIRRVGSQVRATVEEAIRRALHAGKVKRAGSFLRPSKHDFRAAVRVPIPGKPETRRSVQHISRAEIALAVRSVVRDAVGISRDSLLSEIARVFGFQRTGRHVRDRIEGVVDDLIQRGDLAGDGDLVHLALRTDADR